MSYEPDQQLIADYCAAENLLDQAVRAMVIDECKSRVPEFTEQVEDCAHALREASAAMAPGQNALDNLDAEIHMLGDELASFRQQAESDDIKARVAAKLCVKECETDLEALTAKRAAMDTELAPLRNAQQTAQRNLTEAQQSLDNLELIVSNPAFAFMGEGRRTASYSAFRWGLALRAAFEGNHPERDEAEDHVTWLLERSGFRPELSKDADRYRKHWDAVFEAANPPEPAPTGAEIIAATHGKYEADFQIRSRQSALDRTVQEDHTVPVPIPPRNETVRPELRWER
jgi:flagellar biosynthesis chaperone FliJ